MLGVLVLVAAGCSGGDDSEGARSTTVKIGFIGPLTGGLAELGIGMRNSIELAVRQANERNAVDGHTLVFVPVDDAADAERGRKDAERLAADPQVAGIIGTLNSNVSQEVAPVLAAAGIAQISPANTNPTLSRGPFPVDAPRRVWRTYHRVATTDLLQGPFGADYAFDKGGFSRVATVHNNKTYGQGLVAQFEKRWKERGGQVTTSRSVNPAQQDMAAVAHELLMTRPQFVYYGGDFPEGLTLLLALRAAGFEGPLMGGDGVFLEDFVSSTKRQGEGSLATSIGEPVSKLETAKRFLADYAAAGYEGETYGAFGPLAYDSANILIAALATTMPSARSVRAARADIVRAVNETSGFKGVTGEHGFDEFGDTTNKALTVYKVDKGRWRDVFSGVFEQ
jgi:branched-chain amino acid transport system substrate-binding protein